MNKVVQVILFHHHSLLLADMSYSYTTFIFNILKCKKKWRISDINLYFHVFIFFFLATLLLNLWNRFHCLKCSSVGVSLNKNTILRCVSFSKLVEIKMIILNNFDSTFIAIAILLLVIFEFKVFFFSNLLNENIYK